MTKVQRVVMAVMLACAGDALAQAGVGKKFFEGIPAGLYKQTSTTEMIGMGLPKEQERSTETKDRCVTKEEIAKGVDMRSDCTIKKQEQNAAGAHIISHCTDGSINEFRLSRSAGGYVSEIKSAGKAPDGKPFSMNMKSEGKYLGPCK